jgi:hypothetical protein
MSRWARLARRVYGALLAFYPPEFRAEFGNEMVDAFASLLTESQGRDGELPWKLFWREIRGWIRSVVREQLRARRQKMSSSGFMEEEPLPRSERLAAMVLFLLPLLGFLAATRTNLPGWLDELLPMLLVGSLLLALGWAVIKGLPRWSLAYLGFALMLGITISGYDRIWSWIYPFFIGLFGPRSIWPLAVRVLYVGTFTFIISFSTLVGALIVVNLLRLVPSARGVWQRIRADWTQLSFLFYGGLVFGVLLPFDEYHHAEIWLSTAWLALALGAWLYLRAKGQWQRILALIFGATGAMWIVALAKWVLIPLQKWPTGYPVSPSEATRWVETGSALVGWLCILIMLVAPALLDLLPRAPGPIVSREEDPVTA